MAGIGPQITVRDVVLEYVAERDEREARHSGGKGVKHNARARLTKHVLVADEAVADKLMAVLTVSDLSGWAKRLGVGVKAPERTVHDFKAA